MKKIPLVLARTRVALTALVALSAAAFIGAPTARADVILPDPLHGFCNGPAPSCVDDGNNTPLGSSSTSWGFTISPGPQTGDLTIALLLPNNYADPASFTLTGSHFGPSNNMAVNTTINRFSTTAWTSGQLDTYLGFTADPTNPIGAYLPTTQILDPGSTGFFVYTVDLGNDDIRKNGDGANGAVFDDIAGFFNDIGGYIVGFCGAGCNLKKGTTEVATANSGALLLNGNTPPPKVPEPLSLTLLATGLLGTGLLNRRRNRR
jgi:hypothetical protein